MGHGPSTGNMRPLGRRDPDEPRPPTRVSSLAATSAVSARQNWLISARVAADMARSTRAQVLVIHVLEEDPNVPLTVPPIETHEEARAIVEGVVTELRTAGIAATGKLVTALNGAAAKTILAEANDQRPDLIMMGVRGSSGFLRFLLGGVADKVLRHAEASVLLVR